MNRKINKILIVFVIFLFIVISTISHAGFFPEYESIEINLKKYDNNQIVVKNESGQVLETNAAGMDKIETGRTTYGSLIITKGKKVTIENVYMSGERNDFIRTIIIEITNNEGDVDVIKCDFEFGETRYYQFNYNCNNGKITDLSWIKTGIVVIEDNWRVISLVILVIIFISVMIVKIIKFFVHNNN